MIFSKTLIILSAPSGGGKTTLAQRLLSEFPILAHSISATTRPPRKTEQNGIDYFFLSEAEFKKKIQENAFAEWAKVHQHYYGTLHQEIERIFSIQKIPILAIDVQGATQIRKAYPHQTIEIFLIPPSLKELENRLRKRGSESEESIERRLKNAQLEMKEKQFFHKIILNDQLEKAYNELKTFIESSLFASSLCIKTDDHHDR